METYFAGHSRLYDAAVRYWDENLENLLHILVDQGTARFGSFGDKGCIEMAKSIPFHSLALLVAIWGCTPDASPPETDRQTLTAKLPGGVQMTFVWINPGTLSMGSPPTEPGRDDDEGPQRQVTISQGFYLGQSEIPQAQWQAVMSTQPWAGMDFVRQGSDYPAAGISWIDVQYMAQKLNGQAGAPLYRLPTEAEWEYACRAGTTTRWSFGDDERLLDEYVWHAGNTWNVGLQYSQKVATRRPNPWGLYDMHGNLWEWVQDWYRPDYYRRDPATDPPGPETGTQRVLRGGYFHNNGARRQRSANRLSQVPEGRFASIGARLLRAGP